MGQLRRATRPAGGAFLVLRGDGGALTPIFMATTARTCRRRDVLSINDSGVVAFAVNGGCAEWRQHRRSGRGMGDPTAP